jgi:phosphate transport system permease protein
MEAGSLTTKPTPQDVLREGSGSRRTDPAVQAVLAALAAGILVLIGFFFVRLVIEARPAFSEVGILNFTFDSEWVPSKDAFGALPLIVGTLVTSVIALVLGVPVAIATALAVTELAPARLRQPLTILVELLAAVPRSSTACGASTSWRPSCCRPRSGSTTPSRSCRSSAARCRSPTTSSPG